jgi:putative endonuclease
VHEDVVGAIEREKEIKKWRREKKVKLIEEQNPDWRFMNKDI